MGDVYHLCGPSVSAPGETGCREAVWSQGRACRTCPMKSCHRRGMKAKDARSDATELWESKYKEADDA